METDATKPEFNEGLLAELRPQLHMAQMYIFLWIGMGYMKWTGYLDKRGSWRFVTIRPHASYK